MLKSPQQIVAGESVTQSSPASTTTYALPVRADGSTAKYVRVASEGSCYIDFGDSGVDAVATTSILMNSTRPEIFNVAGCTHFALLQLTTGKVSVSPLENQ